MSAARKLNPHRPAEPYERIRSINGQHPFKDRVPGAYVAYRVRKRKGGRVLYFNYPLAKEMGLIPQDHEHKLNPSLEKSLLEAFAIQIINEYDIINGTKIPSADIKDHDYMATRYLQLQHPNKTGTTSGDGRSIWNGYHTHKGTTWDITSCGTGATCLSPATAINKKFYRTGDPAVSYGCGYSEVSEGIGNAIFSEIFHRNGIKSERTLLVIEFPRGLSINVRAGQNLLRPSHFFNHLKQENYGRLRDAVDFFIDRQINNGDFPKIRHSAERYPAMLTYVAKIFAEIAAKFESEYIFCWLDWDGDNILTNGGIIDYGSIRQFGLFHHEYRFDDVERWSTTITEQKDKARYTVQNFAQLCDYLITRKKKPINKFSKHPALKEFDKYFQREKKRLLMIKIGLDTKDAEFLLEKKTALVKKFQDSFEFFERATSTAGQVRLEDGITRNAVFCMRDALRELPQNVKKNIGHLSAKEFIALIRSSYANRKDLLVTPRKALHAKRLQDAYLEIIKSVAAFRETSFNSTLETICIRSAITNRYERITGDALIHIAAKIVKKRKKMPQAQLQKIVESFIEEQVLVPGARKKPLTDMSKPKTYTEKLLFSLQRMVKMYREGL